MNSIAFDFWFMSPCNAALRKKLTKSHDMTHSSKSTLKSIIIIIIARNEAPISHLLRGKQLHQCVCLRRMEHLAFAGIFCNNIFYKIYYFHAKLNIYTKYMLNSIKCFWWILRWRDDVLSLMYWWYGILIGFLILNDLHVHRTNYIIEY